MMRVNLVSDLHLEFDGLVLPGGDVLIISGDLCEAKNIKGVKAERFLNEECAKYNTVVYVLGNHEHYGSVYNRTYDDIKTNLPDNVHLLEDQTLVVDDVTFVGSTLWTDCNKSDPSTIFYLDRAMNDYRHIKTHDELRNVDIHLTPEKTVETFHQSVKFISDTVKDKFDQKFVVVTHHAPSRLSVKPRYADDTRMNGGYSSDLSELILDNPHIKVWTHGHTHDAFDYMIGATRVVCNPRGYAGYEKRAAEFDPSFEFNV